MKKLLLLGLLAGCASSPSSPHDQGAKAPAFQLASLDGSTVRGEDLWKDGPVLIVFMTSWCQACKAEVPRLNGIAKTHRVVAITTGDTREAAQRCRDGSGITYPVLLDAGEVSKAYGVKATPTVLLVEKGGTVSYRGSKPPEGLK